MTVHFDTIEPPNETTHLRERVARLQASLQWANEAIAPEVRDEVTDKVVRCEQRLNLGVDHTIVALAGGTGSGKSSLFNAIAGIEFAAPGVSRPTTSEVSAATWGDTADALLDWLEVAPARRLARESVLDGDSEASLRGLVLLDLPDHDSVLAANRVVVDRMVPMADLLVWVMDPQKYADNALHSNYLAAAAEAGTPSLVLLNHADRLDRADVATVVVDIRRMMHEQGMGHVVVLPVSARTGEGIDGLRVTIGEVVERRSVAAEAVRADLISAGRVLAKALAQDAEPRIPSIEAFVGKLAALAGVQARAEAAHDAAMKKGSGIGHAALLTPAGVEQLRQAWIDDATAGLPLPWRKVLEDAVANPEVLAQNVNAAVKDVVWPLVKPAGLWFMRGNRASQAAAAVTQLGEAAVHRAVVADVLEPTMMMHQAYRALDELTHLG